MKIAELPRFKHQPPENYYYEVKEFKRNIFSIWICHRGGFAYNDGKPTKSIWGFFDSKKGKYFSPVNSKTVGKEVQINNTRSWTSMPIKQTPIELAFK